MLLNGGQAGTGLRAPHLVLLLLPAFRGGHDLIGAVLVGGMVEKGANVVDKKRI